jgi:hypothetical protein
MHGAVAFLQVAVGLVGAGGDIGAGGFCLDSVVGVDQRGGDYVGLAWRDLRGRIIDQGESLKQSKRCQEF